MRVWSVFRSVVGHTGSCLQSGRIIGIVLLSVFFRVLLRVSTALLISSLVLNCMKFTWASLTTCVNLSQFASCHV